MSYVISAQVNTGSRFEITATAIPCGKDWNIAVCGGTLHHVGAIAVCYPDSEKTTVNMIALPGHRDDLVAELFAQKISLAFRCHAAASAGIHIDNASKGDIQILIKSSEKCCEELIKKMKQHSSPADALIHA